MRNTAPQSPQTLSWRRRTAAALLAVALTGLPACGGSTGSTTTATAAPPSTTVAIPAVCDEVTTLFSVAEAIVSGGSCGDWADLALGRAVNGSTGSASLWTRQTGHGTALVVGAVHSLGQGWFGPEGTAIEEALVDPSAHVGVPRLFLWRPDGSGPDPLASPWFPLYNPAIAAERNGNLMHDVLPREDFYVAVADSQKLDVSGLASTPEPLVRSLVPAYDPSAATLEPPTFAEADTGGFVLLLGYPNETGELTAAVGRVLSDDEAAAAVASLAAAGDPEGSIPYDPEVEMIIEGPAAAGMSGGPVVDQAGRLVGVLVRASDEHGGVQYVRAVRMTFVVSRLAAAFAELPSAEQDAIAGYLEG